MSTLAAFLCGTEFAVDWNAISAISTTAAVLVALWIPWRDRQIRHLEKLDVEARAAEVVHQKLAALGIFPEILQLIEDSKGQFVDNPGTDVIYGVTVCRDLIERETFCHQLPIDLVAPAELVVSIARKWCAEIEVRKQTQRDERLRALGVGRDTRFLRSLGEKLHIEAGRLQEACIETKLRRNMASASLIRRVIRLVLK